LEILAYILIYALVFAGGASVGSFLNVVAYRLPAGLSLVSPPSHCPKCNHRLGSTENIPVFGWLRLRGRCRWCRTPISPRYPSVEALTGILFCAVYWVFGFSSLGWGYCLLLSWLLALSLIDWDTMTLPDELTRSGLVLGLLFQAFLGWQAGNVAMGLISAIASGVLGIWLFDAIRIIGSLVIGKNAMGGGDPKLAAMIGVWLGWQYLLVTVFLACLLGSLTGLVAVCLGNIGRRQAIPFGPFLAAGAVLSLFWGDKIVTAYKSIFFPLL
jgi:leader peptidase (prepilin peptidase)/N-methyltransferase